MQNCFLFSHVRNKLNRIYSQNDQALSNINFLFLHITHLYSYTDRQMMNINARSLLQCLQKTITPGEGRGPLLASLSPSLLPTTRMLAQEAN